MNELSSAIFLVDSGSYCGAASGSKAYHGQLTLSALSHALPGFPFRRAFPILPLELVTARLNKPRKAVRGECRANGDREAAARLGTREAGVVAEFEVNERHKAYGVET